MLQNPYQQTFEDELHKLGVGSVNGLAELGKMQYSQWTKVLQHLAELAFACQNMQNITLGRMGLSRVPEDILVESWEEISAPHLATNDEWEYRRIAEFLEMHAPALLPKHQLICAAHADADIQVIATSTVSW